MNVPVLADNATIVDLGEEPDGFWDAVHTQVDVWLTKYGGGQEDDDAD